MLNSTTMAQPSVDTLASNDSFTLTNLCEQAPGIRRLAHGYATSGTWRRLVLRAGSVVQEVATALPRDMAHAVRFRNDNLIRLEPGRDPQATATRLVLYAHHSPTGQITEMVRRQLRQMRLSGFAVVFVTTASRVPEDDWQAVRDISALVVQRQNFGLDFGAWHDLVPEVRRRWPGLRELLLANDSVLGPLHPLPPVIEAMRSSGDGLFGLTESLQGGAHLQSYLLLARGPAVVADLLRFLGRLHMTHSKWLMVQISEIRLARWMRARGHRVAALYGYHRVIGAALADRDQRCRLAASHGRMRDLARLPADQAAALLQEWPLNPTHHLWHVLVTRFQAPFVKTELVRRNPGRLPGVAEWSGVVPADAPCPLPVLRAHLAAMGPG